MITLGAIGYGVYRVWKGYNAERMDRPRGDVI